jgi:hypothetical protein
MVQRPPTGTIPDSPGSYQFKDSLGRVIYVGKASSLRQRLSNYFQDPRNMHPRTAQMVATAESVEWIEVRNEVEALMLEWTLIKQHRPRFNIRLRDDKSYPFLAVTLDEQFRGRQAPQTQRAPSTSAVRIVRDWRHASTCCCAAPDPHGSSTSTNASVGRVPSTSRSAAVRADRSVDEPVRLPSYDTDEIVKRSARRRAASDDGVRAAAPARPPDRRQPGD